MVAVFCKLFGFAWIFQEVDASTACLPNARSPSQRNNLTSNSESYPIGLFIQDWDANYVTSNALHILLEAWGFTLTLALKPLKPLNAKSLILVEDFELGRTSRGVRSVESVCSASKPLRASGAAGLQRHSDGPGVRNAKCLLRLDGLPTAHGPSGCGLCAGLGNLQPRQSRGVGGGL